MPDDLVRTLMGLDPATMYRSRVQSAVGTPQPINPNAQNAGPISPLTQALLDVGGGSYPSLKDYADDMGFQLGFGLRGGVGRPEARAMLRLFRGEGRAHDLGKGFDFSGGTPDAGRGRWFTTNADEARNTYAGPDGKVYYVDVPNERLKDLRDSTLFPGEHYVLPDDLASLKQLHDRPTSSLMGRIGQLPQVPKRDVLPSDFQLMRKPIPGQRNGEEWWSVRHPDINMDGRSASDPIIHAMLDPKRGYVRIDTSGIPESQQGQGIGIAAYQRLIDEAHRLGHEVRSDASVSPEAQRVYRGLAERGYEVRENPRTYTNRDGLKEVEGGGVFTVWPAPK